MFVIWYLMALVIIVTGAFIGSGVSNWHYVICFGLLGAIDMLVCNIVIRLRKKSEFEEWTMKFSQGLIPANTDAAFKRKKENTNKCNGVYEL